MSLDGKKIMGIEKDDLSFKDIGPNNVKNIEKLN